MLGTDLPRNCFQVRRLSEGSRGCLYQRRAERLRPASQALHSPLPVLLCICVHAPLHVGGAVFEHRVKQARSLVGRGGDRFGGPRRACMRRKHAPKAR